MKQVPHNSPNNYGQYTLIHWPILFIYHHLSDLHYGPIVFTCQATWVLSDPFSLLSEEGSTKQDMRHVSSHDLM